ncbi:MAG: polyprenol monophosphomannose synthase [Nocardioidaceae bacterium]
MTSPASRAQGESHPPNGVIMVIPTYNERENLRQIVDRVRSCQPSVDVLIVDDNSPDGTGEIATVLSRSDPAIKVLHRESKEGLGAAYIAGFREALRLGYEVIGEMDADGSHQPEQLHRLLDAIENADLVIGARYVPGGSVMNWPWHRRALSKGGNRYIRMLLGTPLTDATAGFRLIRKEALAAIDLDSIHSRGYVFQVDFAYRCLQEGLRVVEVPIDFVERERGHSKMTPDVALDSLRRITNWGLRQRAHRLKQWRRGLGVSGTNLVG